MDSEQTRPERVMPPRPHKRRGRRVEVEFKGRKMMRFRAERIVEMRPLIERANSRRLSIPAAAKWLGYSRTAVYHWINILGIRWKNCRRRRAYAFDKSVWEHRIRLGLSQGKTQNQIALDLKTLQCNVSRFMKKLGIVMPNKTKRISAGETENGA